VGLPRAPLPAALVTSVIYRDDSRRDLAIRLLGDRFGQGDVHGDPIPFDQTSYYQAEMGSPLKRVFWTARRPVERDGLAAIKLASNEIEQSLAAGGGARTVNLDPGLLSAENFVLATTKNFAHRICLGRGIFAEITLIYRGSSYEPLPWTYPDYAGEVIRNILKQLRNNYIRGIREIASGNP